MFNKNFGWWFLVNLHILNERMNEWWMDGCCCTRQAKNSIHLNDNDNLGKRSTKNPKVLFAFCCCCCWCLFFNAKFAVVAQSPSPPTQFTKSLLMSATVYECSIAYNYNDLRNDFAKKSTTLCWYRPFGCCLFVIKKIYTFTHTQCRLHTQY